MTDTLRAAIAEMTQALEKKLAEVTDLKRSINTLARQVGDEVPYPNLESEAVATPRSALKLRPDEFFGKSPIIAAREYLETTGKPATAEEILQALERGGFDFEAQGWKENLRLRNLAISLGKNSSIFTRLPSGPFGLAKWYPNRMKKREERVDEELPRSDAGAGGESGD